MPDKLQEVLAQAPGLLQKHLVLVEAASTVLIETRKAKEDAERQYNDKLRVQDESTKAHQKQWKDEMRAAQAAEDEKLRLAQLTLHELEQEIGDVEKDLEVKTGVVLHIMPAAHRVRM